MNKKLRTTLLALLLFASITIIGSFAVKALQDNSNEGKITVNKTATKEIEDDLNNSTYGRKAKVDLSITGNEITNSKTLDVVLIIDRSGSMNEKATEKDTQTKMQAAKSSAINLINTLLANNTADKTLVNMGIVTFGSDVLESYDHYINVMQKETIPLTSNVLTSNSTTLTTLVNNIPDSVGEYGDDLGRQGTNIQSGLERANTLLATSTADEKIVILLTDGKPTYFNIGDKTYGAGSSNASRCIETERQCTGSGRNQHCEDVCIKSMRPSEAAEAEAKTLKDEPIEATIYTIGFGIDDSIETDEYEKAVPVLKAIASDGCDYLADNANELTKKFNKIIASIKKIATEVKVVDTIPVGFHLDEETLKETYKDKVDVTHNEDGTTTITWTIGELSSTDNPKLTYYVTADNNYYGGMYTNTNATLTGTAVKENPAYPEGKIQEVAPIPEVSIPMHTENDTYEATLGTTLTITAAQGILDNDSKIQVTDGDNTSVVDTIKIKSVSCGNISDITLNADGSFTYNPNSACYGKNDNQVTYEYEVISKVTIHGEEKTVISNTSTITIDLTKDNPSVEEPTITKTNDNGLTTNSLTDPFAYTIQYQATIENHIGTTTVTIVDKLPYKLDESKTNILDGGIYNQDNQTITWTITINNINSYQNQNNDIKIVKHITVFYKDIPTDVEKITNTVSVTSDIDNQPIETEQETKVVRGNLVVEYTDNLGNKLQESTTSTGLIDSTYTTTAPNTITKEGVEYQLVATKVNGEKLEDLTNNYSSIYVEGTTTVTYVYYKVTEEVSNTNITKIGPTDAITSSNETFDYQITYQATIDHYIYDESKPITITIIDTLPAKLDESKTNIPDDLDGGSYNSENKTITWTIYCSDLTECKTINTYEFGAKTLTITKNIHIVFASDDLIQETTANREIINTVSGSIQTPANSNPEPITDEETTKVEIPGEVIAHYVDTLGNTLKEDFKNSGLVGESYRTSANNTITKDGINYQLVATKVNGKEIEKTNEYSNTYVEGTTEVTYVYYKVEGTIDEEGTSLTKSGTNEIDNPTAPVTYTINYKTTIKDFIGTAHITITDTPEKQIDLAKSNLGEDGTYRYDEATNTITWNIDIENIDTYTNGDKTIDITKTITIVYKNILATDRHINNHVSAVIETTTTSNPITADKDTLVKVEGEAVAHYITSSGDVLAKDETITGLIGDPYTTSEKEFANYKLVKIDGNQTGTIAEDKTEVTYVYYPITSDITNNEVEKTGSEVITSKDGRFYYTIHYQTEIDQYIGDATVTIIDKLPLKINVTESDLAGGIYDQESLTITWMISYKDINTYENDTYQINETKQLILVYEDLDPTVDKITNEVIATVVTDITEKPSTDEAETDIDIKGTVIARYIDDLGNELAKPVTTTGKVGSEYKTEEKDFTDYELILVKGEKSGKYEEGETIVTYIYTKLGKGGDVEPEVEVLPPQTGVDTETNTLPFGILSSIIIGLFLLIKKNI